MAGICSRRKAEEMIEAGRVTVNGKIVRIGSSADPVKDIICVDNKQVFLQQKKYYAFYKPRGYLSSLQPYEGKRPMSIFFPKERIFPIGRLDYNSEGLVLLTNDGDFANRVMHPRYEVEKEYRVLLDKPCTEEALQKIREGVVVEEKKVSAVAELKEKKCVHIILHEGRKHIVKKIFALLGFRVFRLIRVRIGKVIVKNLLPGKYRSLTKQEVISFGFGNNNERRNCDPNRDA